MDSYTGRFRHWVAGASAVVIATAGLALPAFIGTAAAAADTTVYAWGENGSGQLGDTTTTAHISPGTVPGLAGVIAVAAGDLHSLALRPNGDVLSWGGNASGQLGDGTTVTKKAPVAVPGLAGVSAIAAGSTFSLAVRNGQIWSWGANNIGQLGIGSTVTAKSPTAISGLSNVIGVAAGDTHALAVLSDGTVWAWGSNESGQLGDGTTTARSYPAQVSGVTDVIAVSAGTSHSVALRRDGTVLAWGANGSGQVGDGTSTTRKTPVAVLGVSTAVAISSGELHNLVLLADGTMQAWGHNAFGELGDGTVTVSRSAVTVLGLNRITRIASGDYFSLATSADGLLYSWGTNTGGQLGSGDRTARKLATAVAGVPALGVIAGGSTHTIAANPTPVATPPTSWWKADATGADSAGTNAASLGAGVTYANGRLRCAWNLSTSTAAVTLPDAPTLEPAAAFTFSAWVYPRSITGTRTIAAKSDATRSAWSLKQTDGKLVFATSANGTAATSVTTGVTLTKNTWRHVTVTYDGNRSSATDRSRVYVDGFAVATTPTGTTPASIADLPFGTTFGAAPGSDPAFDGNLDQVRFYRQALSALQASDAVTLDASETAAPCDVAAPTTSATLTPAPNAAGWQRGPVRIVLNASDDAAGVGVASLSYRSTGALTLPATTVNAATATVDIPADGVTDLLVSATDYVGNTSATSTYRVRADATAPTITAIGSPAANAAGWRAGDVTVNFSCTDATSGIATCPSPQTITGEGATLGGQGTATDLAGNSATGGLSNVRIDRTPPTLRGSLSPSPNAAGWYRDDVIVRWNAEDALSGVDPSSAPVDAVVATEGRNLRTSSRVLDLAGNATTSWSPTFDIDRTPPTTSFTPPPRTGSGPVTVALRPEDNLSGVASTNFQVDDGPVRQGTTVTVADEGSHRLRVWSVDVAGNVEPAVTAEVDIDRTAPVVSYRLSPAPNGHGWNNTEVTVTFTCIDAGGIASCTSPAQVRTDGAGTPVTGTGTDLAGNTASQVATVNIDRVPPTIAGSLDREPNGNGWFDTPPAVRWECVDDLSGILTCPVAERVGEGADQRIVRRAYDQAVNSTAGALGPVNVDLHGPEVLGTPRQRGNDAGWYRSDVTVDWACSDALSGVAACPAPSTVTGEGQTLTATATALDRAGNAGTGTATVRIDRTAPVTTASVPPASGAYDRIGVQLTATDGLSGVANTWYSLDGAEPEGSTGTVPVLGAGAHSIRFWSVDLAGNLEADQTVNVQLDGLPPTIVAALDPAANAYGWHNGAVTARFSCADAESGVVACGPDATLSREGADQVVTGTARDAAGNTATATVTASIDTTAPLLSVEAPAPYATGWYRSPVTVGFTCADALSGIAVCPDPVTFRTDAGDLATSGQAADRAGNLTEKTSPRINLDQTPPTTTASMPGSAYGSTYARSVAVTLTAADATSGVGNTFYTVDGGATRRYVSPIVVSGGGAHTVRYRSVDVAGNTEAPSTLEVSLDGTPPTISGVVSPAPNAAGWHNSFPAVRFSCADAETEVVSCGPDTTLTQEGRGVTATGTAVDAADNSATATVRADIDLTAPSIAARTGSAPNAAGWYRTPVTVTFSCTDALSGVATCPPTAMLSQDGAGLSSTGTATDNAGNLAQAGVSTINLDTTAPVLAITGIVDGGSYPQGSVPTAGCTATDGTSGLAAPCSATTPATTPGAYTLSATATDRAGNTATTTARYTITAPTVVVPPTITGALSPKANYYGWINTLPEAVFSCTGPQSPIVSCGPNTRLTAEGGPQRITGRVVDQTGRSATTTVTAYVDLTPPTITGSPAGLPNAARWYRSPVTVNFSCGDTPSGINVCPPAVRLTNDGAGQTVTSAQAFDLAGNSATASVGGINLDQTPPRTSYVPSTPISGGWYGNRLEVTLTATDNLSGVSQTYFSVDGAAMQVYAGAIPVSGTGRHTVSYYSLDVAGNAESATLVELALDGAAPKVTGAPVPAANAAGWNNSFPSVAFTCTDAESGVGSCSSPAAVTQEGRGQTFTGTAVDQVGNTSSGTATVNVDITPPSVSALTTASDGSVPNAAGWYRVPVTVSFSCADLLSGINLCPAPVLVNKNAAAQNATGKGTDKAGNATTATVYGLKVDAAAPVLTVGGVTDGATYTAGKVPTATCAASDAVSGLTGACAIGTASTAPGQYTVTAAVTDKAGNTSTVVVRYSVV